VICNDPFFARARKKDLLIAAQTVALDFTLVTDNEKDFSRIGGLRVENWLRD
jgi:tRNA(fMet)-specific endonuclease VapC